MLGWVRGRERAGYDGDPVGDLWAASAEAWADLRRPFRAAYARWREAEARLAVGVVAESLGGAAVGARGGAGARRRAPGRGGRDPGAWYRVDLLPAEVEERSDDPLAAYGLTEREREVLAALAAGHTNREIADELFISVKTASVHVSNILRKLDVDGRQEAARIAHRLGVALVSRLAGGRPGSEGRSPCPRPPGALLPSRTAWRSTDDVALLAGTVSTALFVASYLPMLVKAFRTRDLSSYSRGNLVLANVGNAVYTVYVFSLPLGPIWFLHTFYVLSTALMLVWHLRHTRALPVRQGDDAQG